MRKFIAYFAASADGFIARSDGSYDWLDRPHPKDNYGMEKFVASIDTIVWGRTTYDQAVSMGGPMHVFGPDIRNFVFTHRGGEPVEGYEFVTEPVADFVKQMRSTEGKDIWLMGGAGLYASFLDAHAIDEFSIHVIPVMIGEGISFLTPRHRKLELQLRETRAFEDGVVHLNYTVRQ